MSKFKKSLFVVFFAFLIGFFNIYGQDINPLNNNGAPKIEEVEDKGKITQQNPLELKDILNKVTLNSQDKKEIEIKKDEVLKLDFNLLIDASQQEQLKNQAEQIKLTLPAFLSVDKITSENKGLEINKDKNELTLDFKKLEIDEKVNKFAFALDTKVIAEENKKDYTFEINNDKYAVKLKEEVKTEDDMDANNANVSKPKTAKAPLKAPRAAGVYDMTNDFPDNQFLKDVILKGIDNDGNEVAKPTADNKFKMHIDFKLDAIQTKQLLDKMDPSDTQVSYTFPLPEGFKTTIEGNGDISIDDNKAGTYKIDPVTNMVTILIDKDKIADKENGFIGNLEHAIDVDKNKVENPGTHNPVIPGHEGINIPPIDIFPKNAAAIEKTGAFDTPNGVNPTKTNWNVTINKGFDKKIDAVIADALPPGLTFTDDPNDSTKFKVCESELNLDGKLIGVKLGLNL